MINNFKHWAEGELVDFHERDNIEMDKLIDLLNAEIAKIEQEHDSDDYHDGQVDGLIIAIRKIESLIS